MSGSARALLAGLVVLVAAASPPVPAARAQAYPGARPAAQPLGPPLAPPGATAPAPRAPDASHWAVYHASKKSEGAAVALEFVLPGAGSIYAGHWQGAATTWSLNVAGFFALAWGLRESALAHGEEDVPDTVPLAIIGGFALVMGARIHGLVDAFRSASRYNRGLARRLGLHGGMVLTPMPLQVNGQATLGLGASWRF